MSRSISKRPRTSHSNINLVITNTIAETTSSSIQDLPDELLFAIFLYLPSEQILLTVPLVCQRWFDLHNDACLYRHLVFRGNVPDTSVAVTLIKMSPGLKSLKMASRRDTNEILRYVPICNPRLETLKLSRCYGSTTCRYSVSSICLRSVIEYCPKLRRLSLKDTCCKSRTFYREIGDRLPLLNVIDFGNSESCSGVELIKNADKFHKLSDLGICSNVSDDVVRRFCEKHSSSLTTVKLCILECTDASLIVLATCQLLRTLYLDEAWEATDVGIMEISKLANLEKLHIHGAEMVTSPCWVSFFQTPHMKRIKDLSLTVCQNVNDDVAISIAQNLTDLQKLTLNL